MPTHDPSRSTHGQLQREIRAFRSSRHSVMLATTDQAGLPDASYAPCLEDLEGNVYVFVSVLARHTQNLRMTGRVSVLFIEDERVADNLFARRRLTLECSATLIPRDHPDWCGILDKMTQRLGKLLETLRGLEDFQLICMTPRSATYVRGFGQAFHLDGAGLTLMDKERTGRPPSEPKG